MNKYPAWKYAIIVVALVVGFLYTVPNFFGESPAIQISGLRVNKVDASTQQKVEDTLKAAKLAASEVILEGELLKLKFKDTDTQFKAKDVIQAALGDGYIAAVFAMSNSPAWLSTINALPMYLGLDLRGGVHFLMQVDMKAAVDKAVDRYVGETRGLLREKKVFYDGISRGSDAAKDSVVVRFKEKAEVEKAIKEITAQYPELAIRESRSGEESTITVSMKPETLKKLQETALQQNITALRKRVNELGVSEPIVQQQGADRILIQLAGVLDPTRAKDVIGRTATLEFRMSAEDHLSAGSFERFRNEPAPFNTEKMIDANGAVVLVRKAIIITGDKVTDASPGFDETGRPSVNVRLDGAGGRVMTQNTREHLGKRMAMILIEKGKPEVLSWPTIQGEFGPSFRITGVGSSLEAKNLSLLLRAGALAAPMEIIEERSIGPSLGAENIDKGKNSLLLGFALIAVFMIVYYMLFGVVSVLSLAANLMFLVALLSMLQATLTLPGIAAIALALGMAIDSNVLINERIREELRNGMSPQMAIQTGYERALDTIIDSNITTLIAGLALLIWGSGPVRGFAVVHCLGILTSIFSAVVVSRGLVNLIYGGRKKVASLSIGNVQWHKPAKTAQA